MIKYALILIFSGSGGVTSQKIEGYASRDECRAAQVEAFNSLARAANGWYTVGPSSSTCVPMSKDK